MDPKMIGAIAGAAETLGARVPSEHLPGGDVAPGTIGGNCRPIRLLYLSSLPARDQFAGAVIMHRHFKLLGLDYEIHRAHYEPPLPGETNYTQLPRLRLYHRLFHTRLNAHVIGLDSAFGLFHSRSRMRAILRRVRPAAVITVAEGSVFAPVRTIAKAEGVPLVSIFHDWSPGWFSLPAAYQAATERTFRRLYRDSAAAFYVSEEMGTALGHRPEASLLYPIPDSEVLADHLPGAAPDAFYALYAGSFRFLYAPEVKSLCRTLAAAGQANLLRLTGPDPKWGGADVNLLTQYRLYLGFLDRPALRHELRTAPVQFVISSFEPEFELYARYSFPSKIPEYCLFGRPILLWGPEYSAAVRWARRSGAAWVVTDPNPTAVLGALTHLSKNPILTAELSTRARWWAANEFHPQRLQAIFRGGLERAISHVSAGGLQPQ
jgi:hypothetical protein